MVRYSDATASDIGVKHTAAPSVLRKVMCRSVSRVLFLVLISFLVVLGVVWYYVVIPRYYNISPKNTESHDADSLRQSGWINSYSDFGKSYPVHKP